MESVTFKQALCQLYNLDQGKYADFVLRRTLFKRVRLIKPFFRIVYPDFLFNEIRLVEKVATAQNLREIQEEVDFYQHKYVVNFITKDALRFRISGMRLMGLANKAFQNSRADKVQSPRTAETTDP